MACTDIADGVRVSLGIIEEVTCNITPPGVAATAAIAIAAMTPAAGQAELTRTVGDFVADGYLPGHMVEVVGALNTENNGFYRVAVVTTLTLEVEDPDDETTTEIETGDVSIVFEGLRATERNVNLERDTIETSEVRKDRQFADVRHGFNRVVGTIGYELSLVSYDTMIRLAMANDFKTVTVGATGLLTLTPGTPGDKNATIVRAAGDWVADGIRPGDVLRTTGSGTPANNSNFTVLDVVSATDILVGDPQEVTVGGDPPLVIIYPGRRIDIGVLLNTVTMTRSFNDLPKYQIFRGVTVNNMSWTLAPGEPVGGTFDMLGMSAADLSDTPLATESPQPTTPFMSAFDGQLFEGGEHNAVITSMEFSLENNRQLQAVIGNAFSPGVFEGRASISGTISAFFRGGPLFDKFINEEDTIIAMRMDNAGTEPGAGQEFIAVTLPRVKFTGASMNPPQEGPVAMDMPFRSLAKVVDDGAGTEITTSLTIQVSNAVSDERALIQNP